MKTRLQTVLWGLVMCLVAIAFQVARAPQAVAQDDEETADDAGDAPAEGAAKKAEGGGTAEPEQKNFLAWIIEVSGAIGAVLLVLSIYFVATTVRMFMELRPEVFTPLEVLEEGEKLLQARDFTGLYKRFKADTSFFCTVVSAGVAELPNGVSEARDAMERVGEVNTITLEKKISMLAVLGTLGPMIGLLGTLKGMIGAFSVIAMSDTQLKASQVAGNISEALVLTFEGVALSVPAIYFFALFRNRISAYSASAMLDADAFVRRLYGAMKSKPAAPAPAAATTARNVSLSADCLSVTISEGEPMSAALHSSDTAEPNLTPMLDMVFQLVTFFMLVINFQAAAVDMSLKLPVVGSARPVDTKGTEELLVLNVTLKGEVIVYGQPKEAETYLAKEAQFARKKLQLEGKKVKPGEELPTMIVVRADQKTPFDLLNKVLTECQKNGFRKFALRAMNAAQGAKS